MVVQGCSLIPSPGEEGSLSYLRPLEPCALSPYRFLWYGDANWMRTKKSMKRKKTGMKRRLIYSYIAMTGAILIILGGVFGIFIQRYAVQRERAVLEVSAQQVSQQIVRFVELHPAMRDLGFFLDSLEQLQGVKIVLETAAGDSLFDVFEDDDRIAFAGADQSMILMMNSQLANGGVNGPRLGLNMMKNQAARSVLPNFFDTAIELQIGEHLVSGVFQLDPSDAIRATIIRPAMVSFGIASVVAMVLAGLLGWFMSGTLSKPISRMAEAVEKMRDGDLGVRIEAPKSRDEIAVLGEQLNEFAGRLQLMIDDLTYQRDLMKNFLSDASHELRTPITAMNGYVDLLKNKGGEDPERRDLYLEKSAVQLERMKTIVARLLELTRLDADNNGTLLGSSSSILQLCRIRGLLDQSRENLLMASEQKGIIIQDMPSSEGQDVPDDASVLGDAAVLISVFTNILENAVKFSPESSIVTIGTTLTSSDEIVITIRDQGPGVPQEDLPRIFDRFFRSTKSRVSGSGLGLAIVKSGVELHGGTVTAENADPGLRFRIVLPVSNA